MYLEEVLTGSSEMNIEGIFFKGGKEKLENREVKKEDICGR